MKKFSKKILLRVLCLVVSVVLIFVIPTFGLNVNDNLELIYGTFVGEKSEYNGMIEIWNIDTFEGGSVSKKSLLLNAAEAFQKKYKGIYVLVRNITEKECENMLASGQVPDMFSCSYGTVESITQYVEAFENKDYGIYENFLEAGQDENGSQLGLAWCSGLYFLLSTKSAIEKAGMVYDENFDIIENAYKLGYQTSGKKPKSVFSLAFVTKGELLPQKALKAYSNSEAELNKPLAYDMTKSFTQYEAYIEFLVGNSVALLGSQRDVVRLFSRQANGKISDVICKPITTYCDLVQYLFMAKTENAAKKNMLQKFAEFILGQKFQSGLANANMFSVSKNISQEFELAAMSEVTEEVIQNLEIRGVF